LKYYATVGERVILCEVSAENGDLFVTVDGRRLRADMRHLPRARAYSLLLDGKSFEFTVEEADCGLELSGGAGTFEVCVEDARTHAARSKTLSARGAGGPRIVKAAMPGIVREVCVAVGDKIEKGQALLVLEAMKMQNEIRADREGTVTRVFVAADATVDKGAKLLEVE